MNMTQVSVDILAPEAASFTPTVPRPRRSWPAPEPVSAPAEVAAPARSSRRPVRTSALALDAAFTLTLAGAAGALGIVRVEVALVAATVWLLVALAAGHHRQRAFGESRAKRFGRVIGTGARAAVLVLALTHWLSAYDPVGLALLVATFAVAGALPAACVQGHRPRLVLAGRPRDVREAMLELQVADSQEVVAACLTRTSKVPFGDLPTYVGFDASPDVARRHDADSLVVLPGARLTPVQIRRLHWALARVGTDLCVGTGLLDVTPTRTSVFASGGLTLVRAAPPSLQGPGQWAKVVVERIAAAVGLALLLPALVAVGLLVRLDSSGPAIYRQQRVGRHGRLFTMVKFRSMSTSAEVERLDLADRNQADGVLFKIVQDPRVTRMGRWLRRTSMDELPQLWNVVRGEMSLVGPRPALPDEVARYEEDPRRRLVVRPGMTGLWQVSGRSDLTWAESVRLDLKYVDNWSLRLDLSILCRTVQAVLSHRGAY